MVLLMVNGHGRCFTEVLLNLFHQALKMVWILVISRYCYYLFLKFKSIQIKQLQFLADLVLLTSGKIVHALSYVFGIFAGTFLLMGCI